MKNNSRPAAPRRVSDKPSERASQTGIYSLSEDVLEKIEGELGSLLASSKGRCVFVIDRTGCLISTAGDFGPISPEVMGATAAGVIGALRAMVARSTNPEVSVRFFGADLEQIHFMLLGHRLIICILHPRDVEDTVVSKHLREFVDKITPLFNRDEAIGIHGAETVVERNKPTAKLEAAIESVSFIETKLNELFKDYHAE